MKKIAVLVICIALAVVLAGCGGSSKSEPAADQAPVTAAAPETVSTAAPTRAPAEEPAETPFADDADDVAGTVALVLEMKDRPIEDLYDLIGEPTGDRTYTSSCLVTGGQDGVLEYDGFTVYTLVMPDGAETVYDCE